MNSQQTNAPPHGYRWNSCAKVVIIINCGPIPYNRVSYDFLFYTFILYLQYAKTRLIVGNYAGIVDVLAKTYRREGAHVFFKGFWANTASVFLYTGIFLMTYELVKQWQYDRMAEDAWLPVNHGWMVQSISAMSSSIVGVIICYPISRIITRLQADSG